MKLVKFKDGKYGVRKGFISYEFLNLRCTDTWHKSTSICFTYCRGTYNEATDALQRLIEYKHKLDCARKQTRARKRDKGVPVKGGW